MKRLLLLSFLIASAIGAHSQQHIRLSFVADPSVNWMRASSSNTKDGKSILGYDFGLNSDYYFTDDERYSLSSGILVSNSGGEVSYQGQSSFGFSKTTLPALTKIKYQLRFIEIPMDIKLKTDEFYGAKYWGLLGFSGMVNVSAKGTSNDGTLDKANINDEVNLFNLAMNVGVGFDYNLSGTNSIAVGLIFQNGLLDVTTNNAFSDKTIINSLKLRIGIVF